ncbi:MutS-related protein [Roseivirga sp.]|uniref:MutS-related protein n=1 Tax=Roseivirga sp. TaxID=1964215 RepID=UPI003B8E4CAB
MMFNRAKKRKAELLEHYAQLKKEVFNFDIIKKYASATKNTEGDFRISDATYNDLDFDEVFMFLDRSISKIGQQYLYSTFQIIPKDNSQTIRREKRIQQLKGNLETKEQCIVALSKLSDYETHYITSLFLEDQIQKPNWFWLIKLSGIISATTFISAFFFPFLWIVLVFLLMGNFIIHYWNKKNLYQYAVSLPELITLVNVVKNTSDFIGENDPKISRAIAEIEKIKSLISIFKFNPAPKSDVGELADYLLELMKALFVIEPLLLFRILKKLESQKEHIHELFKYVGELDLCINIESIRNSVDANCQLQLTDETSSLNMVKGYHPLIPQPIDNSLNSNNKSILLTGSNMSGKSTFIRTLGINAIIGQSLNICFAEEFTMPKMHVSSAIRIADDLMTDTSYYFQEVTAIKKLIEASEQSTPNLFLLDELFKGTNTLERIASGKAVLSRLAQQGNMVFVASHDLELSDLLKDEFDTYHFSEQIENGEIVFDYKIKTGGLQKTNAIKILQVNGFPQDVIEEARRIVNKLKN